MGLFSRLFGGQEEPETKEESSSELPFSTPVTEKYGYGVCTEVPGPSTYQSFIESMQEFAENTSATLIYEQDGSITAVSPDGARATVYYQE